MKDCDIHGRLMEMRGIFGRSIGEESMFEGGVGVGESVYGNRGLEECGHCSDGIVGRIDVAFGEEGRFKGGEDIGGSCGWGEVIIEEDLGAGGCRVEEGVDMVS